MSSMGETIVATFENLTPDLNSIYKSNHQTSLNTFISTQLATVMASGALSGAIPGMHVVGGAADLVFLMNRMAVCCYGIGAIKGYATMQINILEEEDFALILAIWCGDHDISKIVTGEVNFDPLNSGGNKTVVSTVSKGIGRQLGIVAGKKISQKIATKIAAKVGTKAGAKFAAGWVPLLGGVVGAGVNRYFLNDISNAAKIFYDFKLNLILDHAIPIGAKQFEDGGLEKTPNPDENKTLENPSAAKWDKLAKLKELAELKDLGIVNDEEFASLKKEILA